MCALGDAFAELATKCGEKKEKVTNEEVGASITAMVEGLTAFSDSVEGVKTYADITDAQAEVVSEANAQIQESTAQFGMLCPTTK